MANNELAIRFTENKYATKSEVARELKMSIIDNIWSNILSYRSTFNRYLTIKSIEKNQLVVCFCPSINALVNSADMKLIRLMREHSKLSNSNGEQKRFEDEGFIRSLSAVARKFDIEASEGYLRSLVHGDIKESTQETKILFRYFNCLNFIKNGYVNAVDDNFLGELYSRLLGTSELTSFYRSTEDRNQENRVLIDRIYTSAPVYLIEGMMDNLFNFVATSSLSAAAKAGVAYYYINYIKPFDEYSDEIALLIAKAILAHSDLGDIGALIPLETLLVDNQDEIARLFTEVQKTSDTTYFLNYAIKQIENKCDELSDFIANLKAEVMRSDFYRQEDARPVKPQETTYVVHQQNIFEASQEEPQPQPQPQPQEVKPVYEERKPVVEERPVEKPVEQPKVEEPIQEEVKVQEQPAEQIAVSYIPPALDEKQACRLEQHLLELDPSLRKNEARFYARHCTLGKSYTIAQYKRMIGCVYETARSAMDHLVELGYYRKDSSNKKFIYTPIPRK